MLNKGVFFIYLITDFGDFVSVASAPGKVLMTGGYLILERPNAGIVLSTNARFYAIVKPLYEERKPDSWAWVCDLSKAILFIFFYLMDSCYTLMCTNPNSLKCVEVLKLL